jgi:hypothetical protein
MAWEIVEQDLPLEAQPRRYFKVEVVIATDEWTQQDLIDFFWDGITHQDELLLVQNIVYSVDGAKYEEEEDN